MRKKILSALLLICLCIALGGCAYFGKGVEIVVRELHTEAEEAEQRQSTQETAPQPDTESTYVLNTKSRKFHLPDCDSVKDIKEANREDYTGSRAKLIEEGYVPCQRCNP